MAKRKGDVFRLRASKPEHRLFVLMLMTATLVVVDKLDKGQAPRPSDFIAWFAVYLVLAFAAEFGEGPARIAVAVAAVSLLTLAVSKGSMLVSVARKLAKASGGTSKDTGDTGFTDLTPVGPAVSYLTAFGEVVA